MTNKIFTCCSSHGFAQGGVYDVYFPLYSKVFLCAPDEQKYLITISMFCLCVFMFIILLLICHIKQNKMDNSHATNKRKQIFYIHTQSINSFYLPVAPKNPVAWHSSMKTRALYLSAREQILLGKKNPGKLNINWFTKFVDDLWKIMHYSYINTSWNKLSPKSERGHIGEETLSSVFLKLKL